MLLHHRTYIRYSIDAQSHASVPPAPGLMVTTAFAPSCLPLIIALSSKASSFGSAAASTGSISASNAGSSSASSAIAARSSDICFSSS